MKEYEMKSNVQKTDIMTFNSADIMKVIERKIKGFEQQIFSHYDRPEK